MIKVLIISAKEKWPGYLFYFMQSFLVYCLVRSENTRDVRDEMSLNSLLRFGSSRLWLLRSEGKRKTLLHDFFFCIRIPREKEFAILLFEILVWAAVLNIYIYTWGKSTPPRILQSYWCKSWQAFSHLTGFRHTYTNTPVLHPSPWPSDDVAKTCMPPPRSQMHPVCLLAQLRQRVHRRSNSVRSWSINSVCVWEV